MTIAQRMILKGFGLSLLFILLLAGDARLDAGQGNAALEPRPIADFDLEALECCGTGAHQDGPVLRREDVWLAAASQSEKPHRPTALRPPVHSVSHTHPAALANSAKSSPIPLTDLLSPQVLNNLSPQHHLANSAGLSGRFLMRDAKARLKQRSQGWTRLDPEVIQRLAPYYSFDLNRVRVHWNVRLLDDFGCVGGHCLRVGSAQAQAIGYDIYMARPKGSWTEAYQLKLLAHELQHTQQYVDAGSDLEAFGFAYFKGWADGGYTYSSNPLEEDARRKAQEAAGYTSLSIVNQCDDPIRLAAYFPNIHETWVKKGWWRLAPGEQAIIHARGGVFMYAETVDGQRRWGGAKEVTLGGKSYPFRELRDLNGPRRQINITYGSK